MVLIFSYFSKDVPGVCKDLRSQKLILLQRVPKRKKRVQRRRKTATTIYAQILHRI
jgi:hypothetical protein